MPAAMKRGHADYDGGEHTDYEPCSSSASGQEQPRKRVKRVASPPALQHLYRSESAVRRPGLPAAVPINSYRVPGKPSPPVRGDDKEGHYVFELGENISSRFKILSKMGEGTFGRVLECWDRKYQDYVAIKIVRNVEKYRHAAMIELEVLCTLEDNDPLGKWHCVTLREWFDYRGHVCMVFEKLGPSLYDFMRRNDYAPFPLSSVQEFARQLLEAVAFMHELKLVHTDIKPENILLLSEGPSPTVALKQQNIHEFQQMMALQKAQQPRQSRLQLHQERQQLEILQEQLDKLEAQQKSPMSNDIRLIDFGSATFEDQYHCSVVCTRHYRAPEVILGLSWSYPCDLWSVGCLLVELATGDALFQTHENLEHLAMMQRVLGPIPASMAIQSAQAGTNFFDKGRLLWPPPGSSSNATLRKSVRSVNKVKDLRSTIARSLPAPAAAALHDLVSSMLQYDPSVRTTAHQALQHEFFRLPLGPAAPSPSPAPPPPQQQQPSDEDTDTAP